MFQHIVYKCPRCLNTLLVSNKMLHDLRCTKDNPATYENILYRQSQQMANDKSNKKCPNTVQRTSRRLSIANEDGTMIDIKKEKNIRGKEELVETKYDKEGNILSRKRADSSVNISNQNNFHDLSEYNEYDDNDKYDENYDNNNNTYYQTNSEITVTKAAPSIVYETIAPQEIVYTAPAKYHPHVTINKPIEETIINSDGNLSDTVMNDIIRQTMNSNNTNQVNINDLNLNMDNLNGYNYSNTNGIDTTNYNQSYNANNYNYSQTNGIKTNNYNENYITDNYDYSNYNEANNYDNNTNYNNQYNFDNQINSGSNDVYTTNANSYQANDIYSNNDSLDILRKTAGMGSMNFSSNDYKY